MTHQKSCYDDLKSCYDKVKSYYVFNGKHENTMYMTTSSVNGTGND